MKFYDRPDCLTLSTYTDPYGTKSGIFVFKNYIKNDLIEKIEKFLNTNSNNPSVDPYNLINWYENRLSKSPPDLFEVWEETSKLLAPDWVMHPQKTILTAKPGDEGMFVHSDSPGKGQCHLLSQNDVWSTCCELDYGIVVYFGDYEGGEIFYPDINPDGTRKDAWQLINNPECLEYKPEKGDVVIHCAFDPYSHGVRNVTSGIRYAFSNFSLKAIDNPGTFYNYGTPEYYEQIGDKSPERILEWLKPFKVNPQFTIEAIKEMQASGLKGKDLSEAFFSDMKE
jgi:hypothetical protein